MCPSGEFISYYVKVSVNGTNFSKNLHLVNFTFPLLEEGALAYSAEGNHPLAIMKQSENYDDMLNALQNIRNKVPSLTTIDVVDSSYNIVYYVGGDWKFLAMCTGIDSAT